MAFAACTASSHIGDVQAEPSQTIDGARLKAKYLRADDGAKQFLGWYDSKLKTDCAFMETEKGQRCLPSNAVLVEPYFGNKTCTIPIVALPPGQCLVSDYVHMPIRKKDKTCGVKTLYSIGLWKTRVLQPPENLYRFDDSMICRQVSMESMSNYTLFDFESLPEDDYVGASTVVD